MDCHKGKKVGRIVAFMFGLGLTCPDDIKETDSEKFKRLSQFNQGGFFMIREIGSLLILTGIMLLVFAACAPATAPPTSAPVATAVATATTPPTEAPLALSGDIARGGRLYDKWTEELGVDVPEGDHPLWSTQTTNTRSGADTWRCKECHGWDYKGVDGAYGSGSHMTGFEGVMEVSGIDANEILAMLKGSTNPDHDFSAYMDDQALTDLALVLSGALMDYSVFINADKSLVGGDTAAGKTFYDETCAECHGTNGLALNFGNTIEPEYHGTIATDNPWEFLHKMRFGQPGVAEMPSLVDDGVSDEDFANTLAYAATFPLFSPISEGGVMYDNWMKAMGVDVPEGDHPLWSTQTTNTRSGADTWRCKECHGWDYKGKDGAYGSGSHQTGFKGVWDSSSMSAEELTAWLNGTMNPDHNFVGEGMLGETQVQMMVAFLQSEKIDTNVFVDVDGTVTDGNPELGAEFYSTFCEYCHGEDGTALNFGSDTEPEFVGTVASDNPWEFVHKVSYGHPGAVMPSGINMDWSLQDIIDLLTHAQTLPVK
jgi:thiosulfate dehydrogenase